MRIKLTPAERRLLQDVAAMKGEIELPRLGEIHRLVSSSNLLLRQRLNEVAVLLVIRLLRNTEDMHTINCGVAGLLNAISQPVCPSVECRSSSRKMANGLMIKF